MPEIKIDTDGHVFFDQDADETLDYKFNFTEYLEGNSISSVTVSADAGASVAAVSTFNTTDHLAWTSNFFTKKGAGMKPSTPNSFSYEALTAGLTGATEPTLPTAVGSTVVDGDIVWKTHRNYGYIIVWLKDITSDSVINCRIKDSDARIKEKAFKVKLKTTKGV